jgi:hypothetical protein
MWKAQFIDELSVYQLLKQDSSLELVSISVCLLVCYSGNAGLTRLHSKSGLSWRMVMIMYDSTTNGTQLLSFTYFYKSSDDPIGSKHVAPL